MAIYQDTMISSNKVLYISGQTPNNGDEISDDIYIQLDVVISKIDTLLKNNGLTVTDLVNINIYLTDREYLLPMREKLTAYFNGHTPTSSLVIVAGLVNEKFKVEIDAIASM